MAFKDQIDKTLKVASNLGFETAIHSLKLHEIQGKSLAESIAELEVELIERKKGVEDEGR